MNENYFDHEPKFENEEAYYEYRQALQDYEEWCEWVDEQHRRELEEKMESDEVLF